MRPHVVHWLEAVLPGGLASALAPTWFTCVGLAGVATLFAMLAIARRHRIDAGIVASIVLWCYLAAVAAGIVVPSALDAIEQLVATGRAQIRWAGMTSFWGYLAGGGAVAVVCRAHGVPLRRFADLTAAPLGLALALARVGCFLAGCDYGKVSSLPWAIRFPAHSPAWQDHVAAGLIAADRSGSLPVHPTQLYEAVLGLAIATIALIAARHRWARRGDGRIFLVAALLYAVGRIAIEDLRGDAGRGIYLGLSSGQIFSLLVLATIAAGWSLRRVRLAAATAAAMLVALIAADTSAQPKPPTQPPARPVAGPPAQPSQPVRPVAGPPLPPQPGQQTQAPGETPAQPTGEPSGPPAPPLYVPRLGRPAQPMQPRRPSAYDDDDGDGGGGRGEPPRALAIEVGVLAGGAAPFNRRRDQVPPLAGGSLSVGFAFRQLGLWLDVDSLGNRDASHGTILVSGGALFPIASQLSIGGRIGVGATLVNFDEPAFRDVIGSTARFESMLDLRLGESWTLWLRPLAIDVLTAADLGGPIATWQARIGIAYHIALGRRPVASRIVDPQRAASATAPARSQ